MFKLVEKYKAVQVSYAATKTGRTIYLYGALSDTGVLYAGTRQYQEGVGSQKGIYYSLNNGKMTKIGQLLQIAELGNE